MKLYLSSTIPALLLVTFGSLAWGQAPTESRQAQKAEPTATRTAQQEHDEEQLVKECVDKLKAEDDGITDYQAGKACREHVKKQDDRSSGG
jgi:hypothetical protein